MVFLNFLLLLFILLTDINRGTRLKKIKKDCPFVGHDNPNRRPVKIESIRFFFNYAFL